MGATKNEKLEVRLIAVDNIKIEKGLQSRCEMHKEYVREFSESLLRGDVFPPVEVFWDGKTWWLADGFHRAEAHRKAGIVDIRCNMRYGTRQDAILYSAGANQKFSIPRSSADKQRAAFLLFSVDGWLTASSSAVAKHIGVGPVTSRRYRIAYCAEMGIDLPEFVIDDQGRKMAANPIAAREKGPQIQQFRSWGGRKSVKVAGKRHILPDDPEEAASLRDALVAQAKSELAARRTNLNSPGHLQVYLRNWGVFSWACGNAGSSGLGWARMVEGAVLVTFDSKDRVDLCAAIGRVILNRAKHMPGGRAIILCYDTPMSEPVNIAKGIGIEFMTPEEFAKSIMSPSSVSPGAG